MYLQFAQQAEPRLELERLCQQARRHFGATLEVVSQAGDGLSARVVMKTNTLGSTCFDLTARPATAAEHAALGPAEQANRSHGMAELGRRCPSVWLLVPYGEHTQAACLFFGAITASLALGPLLPPDRSGLLGVRSARGQSEALAEALKQS